MAPGTLNNGAGEPPMSEREGYKVLDITAFDPKQSPKLRTGMIGAGVSGIMMAYNNQKHMENFDFVIYEWEKEIGGTWWLNRYPGCSIQSANGSIMIVPREGGLVRFYTQLKDVEREPESGDGGVPRAAARIDRSKITADLILGTARKIMQPYTLDVAEISWFTGYQIGQRIAPKFQKFERVFIAGDACHTHSPKAGQGMNISMMDTFNLAWKIAHVVQGSAKSSILSTYEQERHQVAQELIEYDFQLSRLFSGDGGSLAVDANTDVFREFIAKGAAFTTGCTVDYAASVLVSKPSVKYASPLASKLNIGMCIPDARFVMQCDSRPWFIQDRLPSNGTWRIINFAGDFKTTPTLGTQLAEVGRYFGSEESFIKKYTPQGARFDSAFELLLVHACNTHNVEWDDFALAFRQRDTIQLSFGFETQVLTIQEPVDES